MTVLFYIVGVTVVLVALGVLATIIGADAHDASDHGRSACDCPLPHNTTSHRANI